MTWSAFWSSAADAAWITVMGIGLAFCMLAAAALLFWLVVALLTIGDMVRSGEIGRWRK